MKKMHFVALISATMIAGTTVALADPVQPAPQAAPQSTQCPAMQGGMIGQMDGGGPSMGAMHGSGTMEGMNGKGHRMGDGPPVSGMAHGQMQGHKSGSTGGQMRGMHDGQMSHCAANGSGQPASPPTAVPPKK